MIHFLNRWKSLNYEGVVRFVKKNRHQIFRSKRAQFLFYSDLGKECLIKMNTSLKGRAQRGRSRFVWINSVRVALDKRGLMMENGNVCQKQD